MDEIKQLIRLTLAQILSSSGFQGSMKNSLTILTDFTFYLFMRITQKYKKILTALKSTADESASKKIRIALLEDLFGKNSFEMAEYHGYLYFMKKIELNEKFMKSLNLFPKNRKILNDYYGFKNIEIFNEVNFEEERTVKSEEKNNLVDEDILQFVMECEQHIFAEEDEEEEIEGSKFTVWRGENEEVVTRDCINKCIELYDDIAHEKYADVINAVDFLTSIKVRKSD